MAGPVLRAKVTHTDLRRILERQGEGLHRLAQGVATDFETYGQQLVQTRELLTDALVSIEALKIQIAGILARMDGANTHESRMNQHEAD